MPAVGGGRVWRHLAGGVVMVEDRVSPPARAWKTLAVLLHEKCLRGSVRHIDDEGGFRTFLEGPLQLCGLGAFRERLSITRDTGLVRLDHDWVAEDDVEFLVGAGGRDRCPVLVF